MKDISTPFLVTVISNGVIDEHPSSENRETTPSYEVSCDKFNENARTSESDRWHFEEDLAKLVDKGFHSNRFLHMQKFIGSVSQKVLGFIPCFLFS